MQTIDKVTGNDKKRRKRRVSAIITGVVTEEDRKHEEHLELPENMKLTNAHVEDLMKHFQAGKKVRVLLLLFIK